MAVCTEAMDIIASHTVNQGFNRTLPETTGCIMTCDGGIVTAGLVGNLLRMINIGGKVRIVIMGIHPGQIMTVVTVTTSRQTGRLDIRGDQTTVSVMAGRATACTMDITATDIRRGGNGMTVSGTGCKVSHRGAVNSSRGRSMH